MDYNIHMNKKNHGFTLIELIVTLVILGILFAVAAPDIITTTKSNRVTTQYNTMRGDFAFARDMAITRNIAVTLSSNNGTDWSNGWTVTTPTTTVRNGDATNNITISGDAPSLTYNPDGTANIAVATIFKLCDERTGNFGKELNVALTGRVSLTNLVACP